MSIWPYYCAFSTLAGPGALGSAAAVSRDSFRDLCGYIFSAAYAAEKRRNATGAETYTQVNQRQPMIKQPPQSMRSGYARCCHAGACAHSQDCCNRPELRRAPSSTLLCRSLLTIFSFSGHIMSSSMQLLADWTNPCPARGARHFEHPLGPTSPPLIHFWALQFNMHDQLHVPLDTE